MTKIFLISLLLGAATLARAATPIISLGELDRLPKPRAIVQPNMAGYRGPPDRVTVTFLIDDAGAVRSPRATEGKSAELRQAAVEAVAQWRFEPPTRKGIPCATMARQVFLVAGEGPDGLHPTAQVPEVFDLESWYHGGSVTLFEMKNLDTKPRIVSQNRPEYPSRLRRIKSGVAVIDFIVDDHGLVRNAYAVASSEPDFEAPAVAAVSRWTFKPGTKGGHPVNVHMQVPIVFRSGPEDGSGPPSDFRTGPSLN